MPDGQQGLKGNEQQLGPECCALPWNMAMQALDAKHA
jgi:hypothetical protein